MFSIDKILHFLAGLSIAALLINIANIIVTISIVILVAIGKELYDKISKKGTPEIYDILATILGGITSILLK